MKFEKKSSLLAGMTIVLVAGLCLAARTPTDPLSTPTVIAAAQPVTMHYTVTGSPIKKATFTVSNPQSYASLSLYANDTLLVDNLNVPKAGEQVLNALVRFDASGDTRLTIKSNDADITLNSLQFEDLDRLDIPFYRDISADAGLDKVSSIKYGGPTIADMDNDGDYDFITNNHNQADSKLYWNNGDGTVTAHSKNLSRWFMHDLHGTAAGDYDNDGDLDLVVTQGGGNGKDPSKANFYQNNNGTFVLMTGDVNIDRGGRGRGARWSDMDLDGDLDLMLINEEGLGKEKPQHFFYENLGNSTFQYKSVPGLQDVHPSRVLVTDINQDNIDDVILYGPLSVWQGNGDFTFTEVTAKIPADVARLHNIMAVADLDIDNDGDLDLYLARGKEFELGRGETPSLDLDPIAKELSIKPRGFKGTDEFTFSAEGKIRFHNYYFLAQGDFRGKDYPLFLGAEKSARVLANGDELEIDPASASGWPDDITANGVYFGHLGNGQWKAALVRNGDIFWGFKFSLSGVHGVEPVFVPQNRNEADVLLRNDGDKFTDVSSEWNIPTGGNALGVTVGDFNNDSYQDIFVYRWGFIGARISDLMLLNTGKGNFETVTMHGANDIGGPGNGDMGQAFDFDQDGDLDFLNGSEGGEWYLYSNEQPGNGNYATVRVGYAPQSGVDPISAEVIVNTAGNEYRKRVGSAGEVFSQSLLNIVHFGLGDQDHIDSIKVRWRNGETVELTEKLANRMYDTDKIDPVSLALNPSSFTIRRGTAINPEVAITPANADQRLQWSSSDESVLTVSEQGLVTAVGEINRTATITATSPANNLSASSQGKIIEWFAVPVQAVSIADKPTEMLVGQTMTLHGLVQPKYADNADLTWTSSDPQVASIDANGLITAKRAGAVNIQLAADSDKTVIDSMQLTIKPVTEGYIKFVDEDLLRKSEFVVGETITLNVDYHAGTGHKVIAADEGGIRFWLRHFKSEWIPARDIVLIDKDALKTESGSSSMTISLEGLTPTSELPDGHFYFLRASFTSSDGNNYEAGIYPITIKD
ncbi:MAG: CRTAC1 family protein [Gammaproteobacteria bacterium]|nr:CRTAC1 family protein [Gammaproteobacteria bacterium]